MYKFKRRDYKATTASKKIQWQYYVDDHVDGKATGWYNYAVSVA